MDNWIVKTFIGGVGLVVVTAFGKWKKNIFSIASIITLTFGFLVGINGALSSPVSMLDIYRALGLIFVSFFFALLSGIFELIRKKIGD